ncbi:MAG: fliF [Phycisphaerales bacterium]|nr:fliF [Phycisphaerales bacterium]
MDLVKSQFARVQQQLAGLTPSQKMLSGALVTIMVMTLWLWGRYAGTPEMEPLLDMTLAQEDIARIGTRLTAAGIDHKVGTDGRMLVPADRRVQAVATLGFENMLPKDASNGFDKAIAKLTPWDGQDRQSAMFNRAKELMLEEYIGGFPGVSSAKVIIDKTSQRRIGDGNIEPSASVSVALRNPDANAKAMAKTIAHFVSGAHAGLTVKRVKVVVNDRLIPVQDDTAAGADMGADASLDVQYQAEKKLTDKIQNYFKDIDDLRVAVTYRVNNSTKTSDKVLYDREKSLIELQQSTKRDKENTNRQNAPAEGGVMPNVGTMPASPPAGSERADNDNTESMTNFIAPGLEKLSVHTPAGEATATGVTVRVPRSYLVRAAKNGDPTAKEPDAASLDNAAKAEFAKIRRAVGALTQITSQDAITVDDFVDAVPVPTVQLAGAGGIGAVVTSNVKEIALGGLAIVSLFMMSMIVRKGAPIPVHSVATSAAAGGGATAKLPSGPTTLSAFEAMVGEVAAQDPTLDGMELDDDTIKTQQMLSQVTSLVSESPDTAAQLIKRWMNQR